MKAAVQAVADGGANTFIVEHKGLVDAGLRGEGPDIGLVHLSGSTSLSPTPNAKTIVCSVKKLSAWSRCCFNPGKSWKW